MLPQVGGSRVAALEILFTNLRLKDTILNGESEGKTFYDIITAGEAFGMATFDKAISELYKENRISEETARAYASKKAIVGRTIDTIKSERGEKTTDIENLDLDEEYTKEQHKLKRKKSKI